MPAFTASVFYYVKIKKMIINKYFIWIDYLGFGVLTYSYCLYAGLRTSDNWIIQFPCCGIRIIFWPVIDWGWRWEVFKDTPEYLQVTLPTVSISLGWGANKHFIKRKATSACSCIVEV